MFGKDLVVMAEFDESKVLEEMEFFFIPVWVRALKMPLGEMNRATGEAIGGEIGEFMGWKRRMMARQWGNFCESRCAWIFVNH